MKRPDLKLAGIERGAPLTGPETIHIDITNGCNTNCVTCWDHSPYLTLGRSGAWKRQRVEVAQVREILDEAADLGGHRAVILSGMGEPFTHPDVYAMIEEVKRRGLHLTLITNLVAADAERVIALGVDQLLIGIHGASEAAYRAFHPSFQADEWQRLHAMLARFAAAGRRFKHVHVICAVNADELPAMVEQGARYQAAQINFKLASLREGTEAVRASRAQLLRLQEELLPLAQEQAQALQLETNLAVFAQQLAASLSGAPGAADDEAGAATAPIADVGCFMGYVYTRVLVDGTVLYCCNPEVRVGTLADGTRLAALWRGPLWQGLRDRLRRGDYFASCAQCGKFNQNVQLGRRFAAAYGEARRLAVIGR